MMPRVFVDEDVQVGQIISVSGEDGHHYAKVLRVRAGEPMAVAARGQGYLGEITSVEGNVVQVRIAESLPSHESAHPVFLVQGLAKGDKIDVIIQHNTELGVAGFLLVETQRSVMKLDPKKWVNKLDRWQKIAKEAASQAQRDVIPVVSAASSLKAVADYLAAIASAHVLFLDEDEQKTGFAAALTARPDITTEPHGAIVLAVGPEGGWDRAERETWVNQFGAVPVTLGPRTLRTETAGFAAVAAILHHYRQMGG